MTLDSKWSCGTSSQCLQTKSWWHH